MVVANFHEILLTFETFPSVWNPHPIIENMTEQMHCFGP